MKILILLLFLIFFLPSAFCQRSYGAESAKDIVEDVVKESDEKKEPVKSPKVEKKDEHPRDFSCPYYSVHLPPDWKAFRAPEERQGLVYAIFAKNPSSPVVTIIVGPRQGAEPDLIASLFADQFKSTKAPTKKNGQFFFSYPQVIPGSQAPVTANACLSSDGDYFMLAIYTGNQKEAQNFIKSIESKEYPNLLPKY